MKKNEKKKLKRVTSVDKWIRLDTVGPYTKLRWTTLASVEKSLVYKRKHEALSYERYKWHCLHES